MFNELKIIENIDILFETKVILYGAGHNGKRIFKLLKHAGIPVTCFCDGNPVKWGQSIYGKEIISPQMLKELDVASDLTILISAGTDTLIVEIMNIMESSNLRTTNLLTPIGLDILLAQNIDSYRISESYRALASHIEKLRIVETSHFNKVYVSQCFAALLKYYDVSSDFRVLIYQPGKVGSITVLNSLKEIGIEASHTHVLTDRRYLEPEKQIVNEAISAYCNAVKSDKPVKVITLVREPIGRECSNCFYNIESFVMPVGGSFIDACAKWIRNKTFELSSENSCYGYEFDWFDRELKTVFGIDVFAHPFDRESGYSIIKQDNVEVLLIKLEKLNLLETVLGEFVGAPDFKLLNANEGDKKASKYLYKNAMEVIKIPREVVSLYYDNNPRMNYFYTDEEKSAFLRKWEKNIAK